MSIAYTELSAAVLGFLEIDSTDTDRFLVDENLAATQLQLLNTLPFKYISNTVKTAKFSLVSGQSVYQWPNDWVRFHSMWLDYSSAITTLNEGKLTIEYNPEDWNHKNIGSISSVRYPFIDLDVEGGFAVYPVPTANVTNGGRIRYIWRLPNPTSSQDCLLSYNLKNLMVYGSVRLSAMVEEYKPELAKQANNWYEEELARFLPKREKRQ